MKEANWKRNLPFPLLRRKSTIRISYKLITASLLFVLVLSPILVPYSVLASDDHPEYPNSTSISVPSTTSGNIDPQGDRDWFTFNGQAGETYRARLIKGTLSAGFVRIYHGNGQEITSSPDGDASWEATSSEMFYIEVWGSGTGSYQLSLTIIPGGNTAPTISLIEPSSDVTVNQGDTVTIQWIDNDPDDNAYISLARDTDCSEGGHTWLTVSLREDDSNQYQWNTSGVPAGNYRIWGMINDGTNPVMTDCAPGRVIVIIITQYHFITTRTDPGGIGVPGAGTYDHNASAFIGPAPDISDYTFSYWRRDGSQNIGSNPSGVNVTVDDDMLIEAVYDEVINCVSSSIGLGQTVSGSWSSDCESTHRQGRYAQYYTFSLSSSTEVQIGLESSTDTYLYLLNGSGTDGSVIASDDDGGSGYNSRISRTLSAGTYTIEATTYSSGSTGGFTLSLSGGTPPPPPPPPDESPAIIVTVDGLSKWNTFINTFFFVDSNNYLETALKSMDLGIPDEDIRDFGWFPRNADYTEQWIDILMQRLRHSYEEAADDGKKFIVVSHSWGTYLTYVALANLSTGQDPVIPDLYITLSSPLGSMWAHEGQPYNLEEEVIDYVVEWNIALAWSGYPHTLRHVNYWAWADVISGPLEMMLPGVEDVQIDEPPEETEQYRNFWPTVWAHSYTSLESGGTYDNQLLRYRVRALIRETIAEGSTPPPPPPPPLIPSPPPPPPPSPEPDNCLDSISLGGTVSGSWSDDCESTNRNERYAKFYTFTLDSTTEVQIDLESSTDTYLYLLNDSGTTGGVVAQDDDGGSGYNSRISRTLSAGTYTIEATTYGQLRMGSFTLTLSGGGLPPPPPSPEPDNCLDSISLGETVSGSWSNDCESTNRNSRYARFYTFSLSSSTEVRIDLESSTDTYLFLLNGSGTTGSVITQDDDGGSGTNSRISRTLSAGTYTIEATTFNYLITGSFSLTLSE